MKDEVEKLLKLIYGPDVVDDAYASPAGKITKKNARIELLALIAKAQVEAVRADRAKRVTSVSHPTPETIAMMKASLTKEDGETK